VTSPREAAAANGSETMDAAASLSAISDLACLVARVVVTGALTWSGTTPFKAFFTFGGTPPRYGISGLFVLFCIVLFRPFCRLFCLLREWLSLVARMSPVRIRVSSGSIFCRKRDSACSACTAAGGGE